MYVKCPRCLTDRDGTVIVCNNCGTVMVPAPVEEEEEDGELRKQATLAIQ